MGICSRAEESNFLTAVMYCRSSVSISCMELDVSGGVGAVGTCS